MLLTAEDLLNGERVLLRRTANAVFRLNDLDLNRFAFDDLMFLAGMRGKESVGGRLYLTNYRLLFRAHPLNRVRGRFSVFLPTIRGVDDVRFAVVKSVRVSTDTQEHLFVVWDGPGLSSLVRETAASIGRDDATNLALMATNEYRKCGEGLQLSRMWEEANRGLVSAKYAIAVAKVATSRIQVATALGLAELVDEYVDS